jgi:inorganic pyrophosphatase/exopolyphosphatase
MPNLLRRLRGIGLTPCFFSGGSGFAFVPSHTARTRTPPRAQHQQVNFLSSVQEQDPGSVSNVNHSTRTAGAGPMRSFREYLAYTSDNLQNWNNHAGPSCHITYTLGNEAGDADSIVSSLALAYVDSTYGSCQKNKTDNDGMTTTTVPIISILRADMVLRCDVTVLLEKAGIDCQKLLYMDDPLVADHLLSLPLSDNVSLTLTDHNKLRSSLIGGPWESRIAAIYDHHHDEEQHSESCPLSSPRRNVAFSDGHALVGSTCTLIVEHLQSLLTLSNSNGNGDGSETTKIEAIDGSLGLALLSVIALDTMNMDAHAMRGTERDQKAIDFLLQHTNWSNYHENGVPPKTCDLFQWLQSCKFDATFWKSLSVTDCLRLDYKRFASGASSSEKTPTQFFGISSILIPIRDFLSKESIEQKLQEFIQKQDIQYLVVMAMIIDDHDDKNAKPRREMLVVTPEEKNDNDGHSEDSSLLQKLDSFLRPASIGMDDGDDSPASILQLQDRTSTVDVALEQDQSIAVSFRFYAQENARASRKQVAPVLMKFDASALSPQASL